MLVQEDKQRVIEMRGDKYKAIGKSDDYLLR